MSGGLQRRDGLVAWGGLGLLAAWEAGSADLALSRIYGNAAGFAWRDAWLTSTLLHDGGRLLAGLVLALQAIDMLWPLTAGPSRRERRLGFAMTVVALLLVPAIKRLSHTSCPWSLAEFGGSAPYVPHWLAGVVDGGPGHCFPSGHAVSAFAFLSLYFVWRTYRPKAAAWWLCGVCVLGGVFGWSQLARGAHFPSHTLWSAWLCWLVCCVMTTKLSRQIRWLTAKHPVVDPIVLLPSASNAAAMSNPTDTHPLIPMTIFKSQPGLARVWRAARYSRDGLLCAFRHEAAFRQELAVGLPLIAIAWWVAPGRWQALAMTLSIVGVFVIELLNSALETLADAVSVETHPLIKRAKDMGSAAVMLSMAGAALVWSVALA